MKPGLGEAVEILSVVGEVNSIHRDIQTGTPVVDVYVCLNGKRRLICGIPVELIGEPRTPESEV